MTREQRLQCYEKVLEKLKREQENNTLCAVCPCLNMTAEKLNFSARSYRVDMDFPEFFAQKPVKSLLRSLWWPYFMEYYPHRIAAVEAAIKLCKEAQDDTP